MKTPKVSVIMPVFNAGENIREAIDSILAQTFPDFEFLIINDRSTDSSESIVNGYRQKDARIILLQNEKEKGDRRRLKYRTGEGAGRILRENGCR